MDCLFFGLYFFTLMNCWALKDPIHCHFPNGIQIVLSGSLENFVDEPLDLMMASIQSVMNAARDQGDIRVLIAFFTLLSVWMWDCPKAVRRFLSEGSNFQFVSFSYPLDCASPLADRANKQLHICRSIGSRTCRTSSRHLLRIQRRLHAQPHTRLPSIHHHQPCRCCSIHELPISSEGERGVDFKSGRDAGGLAGKLQRLTRGW